MIKMTETILEMNELYVMVDVREMPCMLYIATYYTFGSFNRFLAQNTARTSSSLSVTDTTPPRKQVTVNNMVRNCIFAIVTSVQVQVDTW